MRMCKHVHRLCAGHYTRAYRYVCCTYICIKEIWLTQNYVCWHACMHFWVQTDTLRHGCQDLGYGCRDLSSSQRFTSGNTSAVLCRNSDRSIVSILQDLEYTPPPSPPPNNEKSPLWPICMHRSSSRSTRLASTTRQPDRRSLG